MSGLWTSQGVSGRTSPSDSKFFSILVALGDPRLVDTGHWGPAFVFTQHPLPVPLGL